jgi:hypothetical protein
MTRSLVQPAAAAKHARQSPRRGGAGGGGGGSDGAGAYTTQCWYFREPLVAKLAMFLVWAYEKGEEKRSA